MPCCQPPPILGKKVCISLDHTSDFSHYDATQAITQVAGAQTILKKCLSLGIHDMKQPKYKYLKLHPANQLEVNADYGGRKRDSPLSQHFGVFLFAWLLLTALPLSRSPREFNFLMTDVALAWDKFTLKAFFQGQSTDWIISKLEMQLPGTMCITSVLWVWIL